MDDDGLDRGRWWWRWVCAIIGHHWAGGEPLWRCQFCGAEFDGEHPPGW
jgi:rubrerythrin